ncbi:S1 family peptidase [Amycolatopsis jejuensis]|uniref:S1 family peptidase n=1 Tax=Amycolatopsis jejuensis TaxID=330084 RepID=UPI00068F4642|nr:serine protease [Amycolatopsis jejuensis]
MRIHRRKAWLAAGIGALAMVAGATPAAAINGGQEATQAYPFMASLQDLTGKHFCGGTLVAPRWIVTARHCVVDKDEKRADPQDIQVRLDSNNRTTGGEVRRGTRLEVLPGISGRVPDIALLELDAPVKAAPAALPQAELKPGTVVRALGWGHHHIPENPGDPWPGPEIMLRQLDSHTIDRETCHGMSDELPRPGEICMAPLPPQPGSKWPQTIRAGDSGGPLLTEANGTWTVHSAVSRGFKEQNTVHASVYRDLQWIKDTISR